MSKLSIIIPVYNTALYLQDCLDSIQNQTFKNWECILVDDGSKDKSGTICDEYAMSDKRFKVFHKENGGASSARNYGLTNAIGEWVTFVDADDELFPDSLETMIKNVTDEIDMVLAGYEILDGKGRISYAVDERYIEELDNNAALMQMFDSKPYRYQGYICSKLYRLSLIRENNLQFNTDIYFNEDRLFCTQYLARTHCKVIHTTKPVYKYIERGGGVMASMKESYNPRFETDFNAFIIMYDEVTQQVYDELLIHRIKAGIVQSYVQNHKAMMRFEKYSHEIHKNMICQMKRTGAYTYYLKLLIRDFLLLVCPKLILCTKKKI